MPNEQEALELAISRLRGGTSRVDMRLELLASGFSRDDAARIAAAASDLVHEERQKRRRRDGWLEALAGLSLITIGLGSCVYTFVSTSGRWFMAPAGLLGLGIVLIMDGMLRR